MTYEILYTSAPSGLKPGSSGYCTVKGSRGIPSPALDLLESLSGYRHVFTPGTPEAAYNPVNWGHYLLRISGRLEHVLSRVSDCEPDYTGRSNKLAHHMVVDSAACPAGPAWLLSQRGWMSERWDGQVEQYAMVRTPPAQHRAPGRCVAWESLGIDPGWAGVMAEAFLADPDRKVFVIYKPGTSLLPLFEEALSLLPENRRWDVTFATYGPALPSTVECLWSGIVSGSPEVQQSKRFVNALRINLTLPIPPADGGELSDLARTGRVSKRSQPATQVVASTPNLPSRNDSSTTAPRYAAIPLPAIPLDEADLPPSLPQRKSDRERSSAGWYWGVSGGVVLVAAVLVAIIVFYRDRQAPDTRRDLAQSEPTLPQNGLKGSAPDPSVEKTAGTTSSNVETVLKDAGTKLLADNSTPPSPPTDAAPKVPDPAAPRPATPPPPPPKEQGAGDKAKMAPSDDDGKGRPMEIASAGNAIPPAGSAIAAIPKIVVKVQPSLKHDSKLLPVILPEGSRLPFASVTHTILMFPRDRTDTGTSYYNIIGQRPGQSGTQIVSSRGGLAQLECEWTQKGDGPLSISLIPKANLLEDRRRHSVENAVIQFRNDITGETAFVHFVPVISTNGQRPRIEPEGFCELIVPERFRGFFRLIRPEDVCVSGLMVSMNNSAVKLKPDAKGWVADISEASDGCLQSIEIRNDVQIIGDKIRMKCVYSPSIASVKDRLNKSIDSLGTTLRTINKDGVGLEPHNPLDPALKIGLDEAKILEAAKKLKEANKRHLEKQAKMQNKTEADAQQVMNSDREVDAYVQALVQHRRHQTVFNQLDESLTIDGADVGYKVFSVRTPRGTKGSEHEFPPGHEETVVEAWSYRQDR